MNSISGTEGANTINSKPHNPAKHFPYGWAAVISQPMLAPKEGHLHKVSVFCACERKEKAKET